MKLAFIGSLLSIAAAAMCVPTVAQATDRTFDFYYTFTITGLVPGKTARIWIPQAKSDAAQDVAITESHLPANVTTRTDAAGLNTMFYATATPGTDGTIPLSVTYHVTRHEIHSMPVGPHEDVTADLKPNALVPLGGKPGALLEGKSLPSDDARKSRELYDLVFDYITYSKDKPGWGRGDVNWVCENRQGNCADFHSLFLSLARTTGLPAKMEFGFIIPGPDRPTTVVNYHSWAFFKPSDGDAWVPVDISKAKNRPAQKDDFYARLDPDRMGFTTGRDVMLSPAQAGPALNYFIYPYVEVDGQPLPAEQIVRTFSIAPLPSTQPTTKP